MTAPPTEAGSQRYDVEQGGELIQQLVSSYFTDRRDFHGLLGQDQLRFIASEAIRVTYGASGDPAEHEWQLNGMVEFLTSLQSTEPAD